MSSEDNTKKRRRKSSSDVNVTDARYTGLEPVWIDCAQWGLEKFRAERSRAFNFYNYYLSSKELKPRVLEWMEANGYAKEDISKLQSAPDYCFGVTAGTLCTCMLRGMPATYPGMDHNDIDFVADKIKSALREASAQSSTETKEKAQATPAISPMIHVQQKTTRTVIMDLDVMLDSWVLTGKSEPIDVYASMSKHGLSAMSCSQVERWLTWHLTAIQVALSGQDPYLVEVYRDHTKKQMQERIDALTKMMADVDRFRHAAKATRAPREKKAASATKQVSKLQYCKESAEFKIASINPVRIVGAYRVLAFNVKYRILLDYVAQSDAGLSIKGTTLQNLDELSTRAIRLRKPDEFLPIVLNNTPKQIERAWSSLTTKESKPKARINNEVVLLRVFENRDKS